MAGAAAVAPLDEAGFAALAAGGDSRGADGGGAGATVGVADAALDVGVLEAGVAAGGLDADALDAGPLVPAPLRLNHSTKPMTITAAAAMGTSGNRPDLCSPAGRGAGVLTIGAGDVAIGGGDGGVGDGDGAGGGVMGGGAIPGARGGAGSGSAVFSTRTDRASQKAARFCRVVSTNGCSAGNAALTIAHARR